KDLNFLYFPLGNLLKEETRLFAKKYDIPVANKPESQDICFIPDGNYRNFLSKHKGFSIPGDILDTNNNIIGKHDGIENYTVGQRKHINVSINEPLYVIKINKENNTIIVGKKDALKSKEIKIHQINWLGKKSFLKEKIYKNLNIKVRARQEPIKGTLELLENKEGKVLLNEYTYAVSKGQGCVFYNNEDQLLGGGWIK
ncbi:tRNA 2-thiouridine(34) synthase MnmA, partial [Alphaproteobacteria bacterium]|nr:tRNA 2-thiouridine(34) synthase MnmA [Alphaproteobacteria bacterium]